MSEQYISEIRAFACNFAPQGWMFCDGQLLPISQYSSLFALLGTTYGGDGRTTFALPDLRGRTPVHMGQGPGLSARKLGAKSGAETMTLKQQHLPTHNHSVTVGVECVEGTGNSNTASGNVWAKDAGPAAVTYSSETPDGQMASDAVTVSQADVGNDTPFGIMQPFQVINYCIAVTGIFPSRP